MADRTCSLESPVKSPLPSPCPSPGTSPRTSPIRPSSPQATGASPEAGSGIIQALKNVFLRNTPKIEDAVVPQDSPNSGEFILRNPPKIEDFVLRRSKRLAAQRDKSPEGQGKEGRHAKAQERPRSEDVCGTGRGTFRDEHFRCSKQDGPRDKDFCGTGQDPFGNEDLCGKRQQGHASESRSGDKRGLQPVVAAGEGARLEGADGQRAAPQDADGEASAEEQEAGAKKNGVKHVDGDIIVAGLRVEHAEDQDADGEASADEQAAGAERQTVKSGEDDLIVFVPYHPLNQEEREKQSRNGLTMSDIVAAIPHGYLLPPWRGASIVRLHTLELVDVLESLDDDDEVDTVIPLPPAAEALFSETSECFFPSDESGSSCVNYFWAVTGGKKKPPRTSMPAGELVFPEMIYVNHPNPKCPVHGLLPTR